MDVGEKLVELLEKASYECDEGTRDLWDMREVADGIADFLIANGVTVQEDCKACAEATQICIVKLQEQIAELRSVQEWIPVAERLPDSGKYVLLYCNDGLYGEGHYRAYENQWYLSKITYKSIPNVTHWMPLPPAPKGE